MTRVTFYEKPGCANNARQKQLLQNAGHELDVRNLLAEPWTAHRLRSFFGTKPVAEWFNKASPRIKSGEIDPASLDAERAIELMLEDPLLVRRPLMEAEGTRTVGFDPAFVEDWIGLSANVAKTSDLETCRRPSTAKAADIDSGAAQ